MKLIYYFISAIGLLIPVYLSLNNIIEAKVFTLLILIYLFIYRPICDIVYLKIKRKDKSMKELLKKYPFWTCF